MGIVLLTQYWLADFEFSKDVNKREEEGGKIKEIGGR
jgi:hypothetical protein